MEHWSIEDYKNFTNGKIKKTKYRANKTSIDGHTFDSKKEAEYYCELKWKLQANEINGFCLQPTFMLAPGLKYKADFMVYHNDGSIQVIDVKGQKTADFKLKEKMFNYMYPQYNKLFCVVKYNGEWLEYDEANKIKKSKKKNKK
jgi:hypothetical protein